MSDDSTDPAVETDDVLSQGEINELLSGLDDGDESGDGLTDDDDSGDAARISILDLQRPDLFTQPDLRRLSAAAAEWAGAVASSWTVRSGAQWTLEVESVDPLTFDEYRRCVPSPGVFVTVVSTAGFSLLVEPDAALAGVLARTALGYPPIGAAPEIGLLHRQAIAGLISATVACPALSSFGCEHQPAAVTVTDKPERIQLTDSLDMVLVVPLTADVDGAGRDMRLNVCIPSVLAARFVIQSRSPHHSPREETSTAGAVGLTGRLDFPLGGLRLSELQALGNGTAVPVDTAERGQLRLFTPEEAEQ